MANGLTAPVPAADEHGTRGRPAAFHGAWVSAALHAAALALLCCMAVRPRPPDFAPHFTLVVAPPPVYEQNLPPTHLAAPASIVATSLIPPAPVSLPAPRAMARHPAPRSMPSVLAREVPQSAPPQTAPAPKDAPPPPVLHDVENALEARIHQAVQEAVVYPSAARAMHMEGRTQVRFDYTDGTVSQVDVADSSRSAMLDRAAVAAVRRAALPRAPGEIGSRTLALLVWVDFRMVRQD